MLAICPTAALWIQQEHTNQSGFPAAHSLVSIAQSCAQASGTELWNNCVSLVYISVSVILTQTLWWFSLSSVYFSFNIKAALAFEKRRAAKWSHSHFKWLQPIQLFRKGDIIEGKQIPLVNCTFLQKDTCMHFCCLGVHISTVTNKIILFHDAIALVWNF